jgi:putative ABC transport system permease protein
MYLGTVIEVGGITAEAQVRGVTAMASEVYQQVTPAQGTWPSMGRKIAVGASLAGRFGLALGDTLRFQNENWTVAGIFQNQGRVYDREVWVELDELAAVANRSTYSNYVVRTTDAAAAAQLVETINQNRRYALKAMDAPTFFRRSGGMSIYMAKKGVFLSFVIAIGTVFAAMNTMYAAIAARRREIAILKAIGYRPLKILVALTGESVFMGLLGGVLGLLIASGLALVPVDLPSLPAGYVNIQGREVVSALLLSLVVGLLGGLLPAIQAAGTRVVRAFR